MKRLKRLTEAVGQSDYSYDRRYFSNKEGGKASRKNQRVMKKIVSRIQRRKDKNYDVD